MQANHSAAGVCSESAGSQGSLTRSVRAASPYVLLSSIALAYSYPADAQTQVEKALVLEEVVVTAQKREEDLQQVPLSVSVVGSDQLEALGATKLQDYIAYVPNVVVASGGAPGLATITIRGLSPAAGGTTLVTTYIDDTPVGSSGAWAQESSYSLDLQPYDVERIEVLRGPQGTLYGANSMGGLLKYVTRDPQLSDFEARVGADVFSVDQADQTGWGGHIGLNAPLIADTLGIRVSGYKLKTPGYIDNPDRARRDENAADQYGGRAAALWQVTPALSIKASAIIQRIDADGVGLAQRPVGGTSLKGTLVNPHPLPEPVARDLHYYSLAADWDLGWATAFSATSYSQSTVEQVSDFSATLGGLVPFFTGGAVPTGYSAFARQFTVHRTTQELRLVSPSEGRFEWLVGAYYSHEKTDNHQSLSALGPGFQPVAGLDPFVLADIPALYKEIAGFANVTFEFTPEFDVTAGLRWARNTQDYRQNTTGFLLGPPASVPGDSRESVVTYAVSPRYHLSDTTMLYLRAATGYRAGGPNVALPNVPPQVNSDRTRNYEAGIKSSFLEGRAIFDASVFRTNWTDIQLLLTNPSNIQYFSNAGTARTQGVELVTSFSTAYGLRLGLNAAYLDAKLTQDVPALGWKDGARLPASPKWTASATADYARPLGATQWTARAGVGIRYVAERLTGVAGTNPLEETPYSPVDLYVRFDNQSWDINLYARNALNQRRFVSEGLLPGFIQGSVLEPRTIGLSVDRMF